MLAEAGYAVVLRQPARVVGLRARRTGCAIRGAFGTVDTEDVLALLGAALEDPALDGERVGVMGGSYGGYLTAWLTTRTDRFVAAIVERGFLDPVSFVGSSDIGWFFGLEYLGDAADEARCGGGGRAVADGARRRGPHARRWSSTRSRTGAARSSRVSAGSSSSSAAACEAELLLFPGEGHELTRSGNPKHRRARFEHVLRWWETHLPRSSSGRSSASPTG